MAHTHCRHHGPARYTVLNWPMMAVNDEGRIFWHIVNFTPDLPKDRTLALFDDAMGKIQTGLDKIPPVGRYIHFEPTKDFHQATMRFFFMNPFLKTQTYTISDTYELVNEFPFDGKGGTLGQRLYKSHDIYLDEAEDWVGEPAPGKINLVSVLVHETLHAFGLGHTSKYGIMRPYYDSDIVDLQQDDLEGLAMLWSPVKYRYAPAELDPKKSNPGCAFLGLKLR